MILDFRCAKFKRASREATHGHTASAYQHVAMSATELVDRTDKLENYTAAVA
jgi:hypothetical protein